MDPGQDMQGYGKGCPWTCGFYGKPIKYRGEDYPETIKVIAEHSYPSGVYPPNTMALMERYVEAFGKVMARPEVIAKVAAEAH